MNKKWIIYPKKTDDFIDQLLINRGIDLKDKDKFLNPDFDKDLLDPFKITGMDKLVKRFQLAIDNKEKIGIFADYDADGIPGAALLYKVCKILGLETSVYIPSRHEGYGLNKKGIQKLKEDGCNILISIDLGITNKKEVVYAKKLGMDVIITDHHEIQKESFPDNAFVVIHTHLSPHYSNKDLAGGAVVYKIAQALSQKLGKPNKKELKWLLDLAAISTICDIVPLVDENRLLAKYGLIVLSKTKNLGLQKLYQIAQIEKEKINTYVVGFLIGPRINAPGRIARAESSYFLLTTQDEKEASLIAKKLNDTNLARQKSLNEILNKVLQKIKREKLNEKKIIIIKGTQDWLLGIIGLVSSKITELYSRPSIVFSKEDGVLRGSARSVDKFNLVENLKKAKKYLISLGGHAKAAGLALKEENYDKFYKKICDIADKTLTAEDLIKEIKIDAKLSEKDLKLSLAEQLKQFEPFGLGNPRPVFLLENMKIDQLRWMGREEKHLKLNIKIPMSSIRQAQDRNVNFEVVSFNCKKELKHLKINDIIDIVFSLEENIWNGRKNLQLKLIDLKIK